VGAEQLVVVRESRYAEFAGHALGCFRVGIDHPDQFHARIRGTQGRIFLGMEAAQVADADYGSTQSFGHHGEIAEWSGSEQ
jgi:hypothetical protein